MEIVYIVTHPCFGVIGVFENFDDAEAVCNRLNSRSENKEFMVNGQSVHKTTATFYSETEQFYYL